MNKDIMRKLGFDEQMGLIEQGLCPICGNPININDFRDAKSHREYEISGMCQVCQDVAFADKDPDQGVENP